MAKNPERNKAAAKQTARKKVAVKAGAGAKNALATKKVGPMHLPLNAAPHGDQTHNRDWAGKPPPKKFSMPRK